MGGPGSGRRKGSIGKKVTGKIIGPGRKKGQMQSIGEYSQNNSRKFMKPKDIKKANAKVHYLKKIK